MTPSAAAQLRSARRLLSAALLAALCMSGVMGCSGDVETPADTNADIGEDVPDFDWGDTAEEPDVVEEPVPDVPLELDGDLGPDIEISGLTVIENPFNALAAYVTWTTSREGTTILDVSCTEDIRFELRSDERRTRHEVFVMGLLADTTCTFTAESVDEYRRRASASETFDVGSLPDDLPGFTLSLPQGTGAAARLEPGWTLMPLANQIDRTSHWAVLVDQRGRVRWYRELPNFGLGSDNDIHEVPQGVLFGATSEREINDPVIISWEGDEVWRAPVTMHHHISVDPNDGTFLYLGRDFSCPEGPSTKSDTVERYDPVTETTTWIWYTCDHYTPEGGPVDDWDHLNTIEVFPGDDDLLISVRNENQLWRIDPATDEIVWRLGWGGQFDMSVEDRFLHQHAPQILPNGNILLFDNGLPGARPYSRVVEIAYDTRTMTAEVVWEYRHDPDIFSQTMGQAFRTANGNTVVTFTGRSEDQPSVIVEIDAEGEELWELTGEPKWTVYRSRRIPARFGYVVGDASEVARE
jgi:hypothetical protein